MRNARLLMLAMIGAGFSVGVPVLLLGQTMRDGSDVPPARPMPAGMPGLDALESVKKQIAASDEEWKVIGPQLRKVLAAQRGVETGGGGGGLGMGFGPPRGFGGPGAGRDSFSGPGGPGGPGGFGGARGPGGRGPGAPGDSGGPGGPMGPGFAGPGQGPPRGGPGMGGPSSAVSMALADLQTAIADASTTPEQLKEKMAAVRSAKAKAKADLAAAQKELRELLTDDQVTVLVSLGMLE